MHPETLRPPYLPVLIALCVLLPLSPAQDRPEEVGEVPSRGPQLPGSWMKSLEWRCIGPANMGGRITAIAVHPEDRSTWWVATASGGLLKTTNHGTSFEHQFDHQATVSIGDVAVAPSDPDVVWVGTGEANPRNSVSWGNGAYKSEDGGRTWKHMGLENTFQTGRIVIHPQDPDVVYVGALGRLWGPNEERGLYKTTDGGETWERILYVDERTGVADVCMHPQDPETLLVATYERRRDAYCTNDPCVKFGPGAGLHKTTDGGKTWKRITAGLPTCDLGRIGLDWYPKDPRIVYMVLESARIGEVPEDAAYMGVRGESAEVGARLTEVVEDGPAAAAGLEAGDIVVAVGGEVVHSWRGLLDQVGRYKAEDEVEVEVSRDRNPVVVRLTFGQRPDPREEESREDVEEEDRPDAPFRTRLGGQREGVQAQQGEDGHEFGGVYRSEDGGETWKRVNSLNPRPMYFSRIRVDPTDDQRVYVLGIRCHSSEDGGRTFERGHAGRGVHVDHHDLWIDPEDGRHQILGNDGGVYVTFDRGETWDHLNHAAIGQFYDVEVGPRRNYMVYGGLQDNGTWGGPSRSASARGPANPDWIRIGGGDGFVCRVDPLDPERIYFESQNGGTARRHLGSGEWARIRARNRRERGYRFNWKTPFLLSHHNPRIYYVAGNHVFRSLDRGEGLRRISPEISRTDRGKATALAESPRDEGVLYVGTDDGALWGTRDGGHTWTELFKPPAETPRVTARGGEPSGGTARAGERPAAAGEKTGAASPETGQGAPEDEEPAPSGKPAEAAAPPPAEAAAGPGGGSGDAPLEAGAARQVPTPQEKPEVPTKQEKPEAAPTKQEEPAGGDEPETPVEPEKASGTETQPELGRFARRILQRDADEDGRVSREEAGSRLGRLFGRADRDRDGFLDREELQAMGERFTRGRGRRRGGPGRGPRGGRGEEQAPERGNPLHTIVPGRYRVSSLVASGYEDGRVYATFDGHRSDDDRPYVVVSEDYGATWHDLGAELPAEAGPVRIIAEDLENAGLLYLGTEFGAWVSVDRGRHWTRFGGGLPTVAVHDFAQHPTAREIVAGTHGRSLWVLDVSALRQMDTEALKAPFRLYRPATAVMWRSAPRRGLGLRGFQGENPPYGAVIYYSLAEDARGVELEVRRQDGSLVRTLEAPDEAGLHRVVWNLREEPRERRGRWRRRGRRVDPGTYVAVLTVGSRSESHPLEVRLDPDHPEGTWVEYEDLAEELGGIVEEEDEDWEPLIF